MTIAPMTMTKTTMTWYPDVPIFDEIWGKYSNEILKSAHKNQNDGDDHDYEYDDDYGEGDGDDDEDCEDGASDDDDDTACHMIPRSLMRFEARR